MLTIDTPLFPVFRPGWRRALIACGMVMLWALSAVTQAAELPAQSLGLVSLPPGGCADATVSYDSIAVAISEAGRTVVAGGERYVCPDGSILFRGGSAVFDPVAGMLFAGEDYDLADINADGVAVGSMDGVPVVITPGTDSVGNPIYFQDDGSGGNALATVLPGGAGSSSAWFINEPGDMAGVIGIGTGHQFATVWPQSGGVAVIDGGGAYYDSRITDLNNLGQAIGTYQTMDVSGVIHSFGFVRNADGVMETLGENDIPYDINNLGQILLSTPSTAEVATPVDTGGGCLYCVRDAWSPVIMDRTNLWPYVINDLGQVAGLKRLEIHQYNAFLITPGTDADGNPVWYLDNNADGANDLLHVFTNVTLGDPGIVRTGAPTSDVLLDNYGNVVVFNNILNPDGTVDHRGARLSLGQPADVLGTLTPGTAGGWAYPWAMNERGTIAGWSNDADQLEDIAATWQFAIPVGNQVGNLGSDVGALVDSGSISSGTGSALGATLNAAGSAASSGNTQGAITTLEAFIKQVQAQVKAGKISQAEGDYLISEAEAAIAALAG